jgi:MarR family transcriptional regulator, 2-MHQ and catechol-resistance regulon repressor
MTAESAVQSFDRLVETHGLLWRLLDDDLERALGLPLQWYGVLRCLGQSADGLCSMSELTAVTTFTSGGVTRLVDRMEQAGYVERLPCPKDRRVHYVGLTDCGRALLHRATDLHQQGLTERVTNVLEPQEVEQLDTILAKLAAQGQRP